MTVTCSSLLEALWREFPKAYAEDWDNIGLIVGSHDDEVRRVALALDVTPWTVRYAIDAGCQLLLTHHPATLKMPARLGDDSADARMDARAITLAIKGDLDLIAMHTNLDRSARATAVLPGMLGLNPTRCGIEIGREPGKGRLGSLAEFADAITLSELSGRCLSVFGQLSQVYGDPQARIGKVAFFTGSLGDNGSDALMAGADVIVCGECGYHRALDLESRGCAVIVLGHDVSELPLVSLLRDCVIAAGVDGDDVVVIPEAPHWWVPSAL